MRPLTLLSFFIAIVSASGCVSWLPTPVPMRSIDYRAQSPARCLVVLLPGRGNTAEVFQEHGFIDEVRKRALSIDLVAANATLGYYAKGVFSTRLTQDVIAPRRARGYAEIWLIGTSMGGFGSLLYSRQNPGQISGAIALAPYLGDDPELFRAIRAAGGLSHWQAPPPAQSVTEANYQSELWRWLQSVTRGQEPSAPDIYLGYGSEDRLARFDALLGAELPKDRVHVIPGAHNWTTWKLLFRRFLDTSELRRRCGAAPATPAVTPAAAITPP